MDAKKRRPIGHIVQRGQSWYVPVYLGRDPVTKKDRPRRWVRFDSYREARAGVSRLREQARSGQIAKATNERVGDYLDRWLENRKHNLAEKTYYDYRGTIRKHLAPAFGYIPLRSLSAQNIDDYLSQKLRGKQDAEGKWIEQPLSPTSAHHHFTLLNTALRDAVKKGVLLANPCAAVERPKRERPEMRVLDEEQLRLFLGQARRQSPYYSLYLTAALTGMRQAELCGLKWENVDLLTGQVFVQGVFYRLAGRQIWKEPKSKASRRSIPLAPELVEELRTVQARQSVVRKELGSLYQDHGLVFCQSDGKPLHSHNIVRRDFHKVLTDAKLPRIRFHDLRHSYATWQLREGTHPKIVQSLLGHSSYAVTMDLYSHAQKQPQDIANLAMAQRLLSSNEPSIETMGTTQEPARRGGTEKA